MKTDTFIGNKMSEAISFGAWLRQKRRTLDMSQKAFADQVGCAEVTVRRMEADAYKPSKELALVLFEKLGIPEPDRPEWVRFARGLAKYPDHQANPSSLHEVKTNLPTPLTSFIGREKEREEIKCLLAKGRLITIVGAGGMGKTRLSLEIGHELLREYPDGVWFVPLAPVQSDEALIPAIAKAFGLLFYRDEESPRQQLLNYLREKHLLVILDGFEHLAETGAELITEVLSTAKFMRILVTSRERLNLQAEQLFVASGMRFPDAADIATWNGPEEAISFSAMQLFAERARRLRLDFRLTGENLAAVTEICKLVDGMPLGIELAATWAEILSPEEIAREIIFSLDFLSTDLRDVADRQRSIRAVFESSWRLLRIEEQTAFQQMTVFQGSFSGEAAQRLSGSSLHMLRRLVNKSWLQQMEGGRYQLHDVLKQYGYELLQSNIDEWRSAKDRHAEYYIEFIEIQGEALKGERQLEAIQTLNTEFASNIQGAWNWLVQRQRFDDLVKKILPGLFHFCLVQSQGEGLIPMVTRARESMFLPEDRDHLLQQVIFETVETFFGESWAVGIQLRERLINLLARVDDLKLASEMEFWFFLLIEAYFEGVGFEDEFQGLRECMKRIHTNNDSWMSGYVLLSSVKMLSGLSLEEEENYLKEALVTFQKLGVVHEQGLALQYLGSIAWNKKSFDEAEHFNRAARKLFEQAEDQQAVSHTWYQLSAIHISRGDLGMALHANQEQFRIHERTGNRRLMGTTLSWESIYTSRYGSLEHALEARKRSLALAREIGHLLDIAWNHWNLGDVYRLMGETEQAGSWYQQAIPLFESLQEYNGMGFYYRGLGEIALDMEQWEIACSQFQKSHDILGQEHRNMKTWSLAYTQAGLGRSLIELGNISEAKQVLQNSLRNAEECGNWDLILVSLTGFARLYAAIGISERAISLAACVANHRISWIETKKQARAVLEIASHNMPGEIVQPAQGRGLVMTVDHAIACALKDF